MAIHAKLLAAQKAIHGISKTGYNNHFAYRFFEEREVLQVARDALNNAGLAFFYSVEDVTDREVETKSGKVEWITDVRMLCTLYDGESGEKIEGKAIGRGQDGQDKGINKGIVAGIKYWLLKTLMIPTEDDTERTENTVAEGNKRAPAKPPSEPIGVKHSSGALFSLAAVAPGAKAEGKTWNELLTTENGRGYTVWAIGNMTRLDSLARTVLLQQMLNMAAEQGAIDPEQSARIEGVLEEGAQDKMAAAAKWLNDAISKKKQPA